MAAVLGVTLAAFAPPVAQACDAGEHLAGGTKPTNGRRPLLIGDSVMLGAAVQLARAGFEVDAHGCRVISQGLALLRARRHAGTLPDVVGVALGTNGSIARSDIRAALRIVGSRRTLALLTPRETGGVSGRDASVVPDAGRRYPGRVVVVDWVRYAAGRSGWFAGDGIHLGAAGAQGMVRLLRRALAPPCPR
jgi:hypothetical protein